MPLYADTALASRLEALCAAEMRRFVDTAQALEPALGATALEIGGGVAPYVGPESPVNQAFGLGFDGPVDTKMIFEIEQFYRRRDTEPLMGVSPLAHRSLHESLAIREWVVDGYETVLYREYKGTDNPLPSGSVEIREVTDVEGRELWTLVAATAFSAPLPPLEEQLALGRIVVHRPGSRLFLAYVDDKVAGTGELYVEDGVAWLSADSTLPQFRRRGVQTALQAHRLRLGAEAGCELAASEASPGSISQRNIERFGFRVAYTRVDFICPKGGGAAAR